MSPDTEKRFVDLALARGLITRANVEAATRERAQRTAKGGRFESIAALLCQGRWLDQRAAVALLNDVRTERSSGGSPVGTAVLESRSAPAAPRRLGHYEIVGELGRGGMGVVYRARDLKLGRDVALKTISGIADEESVARFVREARAVARLDHPGIVRVHDAGVVDGVCFAALELVEGGSVEKRLAAKGPLPPRDAAALVRDLALAVQSAHDSGIVHRDLKPANVLLGADGRPRLTDFGLARSEGASQLTETGVAVGTPGYMAPEQAHADPAAIGPHTDIYGLGAVLYALLAGRAPFHGGTGLAVMHRVIHEEVESPSRARAAKKLPPLHQDLETICLKALSKEKAGRYARAADLAADLSQFLEGEPILARPPGSAARAWRFLKRRRLVAVALVSGFAVAVATIAANGPLSRWMTARTVARHMEAGRTALKSGAREDAVAAFGSALAVDRTCLEARLGRALAAAELGSQTARFVPRREAGEWATMAVTELRELNHASPAWAGALLAAASGAPPSLDPGLDAAFGRIGRNLAHLIRADVEIFDFEPERYDLARSKIQYGLRVDPGQSELWAGLALVEFHAIGGNLQRANAAINKALELRPRQPRYLIWRATIRGQLGDLEGSLADASLAVAGAPDDFLAWRTRGEARAAVGDLAGAMADHDVALDLSRRTNGIMDFVALVGRARLRHRQNDPAGYPETEIDLDAILALEPADLDYRLFRAEVRHKRGNLDGALQDIEAALRYQPDNPRGLFARAGVLLMKGDVDAARKDLERCAAGTNRPIAEKAVRLLEMTKRR